MGKGLAAGWFSAQTLPRTGLPIRLCLSPRWPCSSLPSAISDDNEIPRERFPKCQELEFGGHTGSLPAWLLAWLSLQS